MSKHEKAKQTRSIQIDFPTILKKAESYEDIAVRVIDRIKTLREEGVERIGFVSGPLGSTPKRTRKEDTERMKKRVIELSEEFNFPIFASTDIFFEEVWAKLKNRTDTKEKMTELFKSILGSGYMTDIFMMEDWKLAPGCWDEYEIAKEKLNIHEDKKE